MLRCLLGGKTWGVGWDMLGPALLWLPRVGYRRYGKVGIESTHWIDRNQNGRTVYVIGILDEGHST